MTVKESILRKINQSGRIGIFCHTNPDADTIGSALALRIYLEKEGKKADVYCDSDISSALLFLKGVKEIKKEGAEKYDLHIALDCGDRFRFGDLTGFFFCNGNTINIDHHHLSNDGYAQLNWVEARASTSEMIYELLEYGGKGFDNDAAECLMAGILTDTNSFTNSNTDSRVMMTAAKLVDRVDINELSYRLLKNMSYEYAKLKGKAEARMRRYFDGRMTLIYMLEKEYTEAGLARSEIKGLVDSALRVEGTLIAVSVLQTGENKFDISMRGRKNTDVSKVCLSFGGGGHRVASGCVINGFFEDVVDKIVRAIRIEGVLDA